MVALSLSGLPTRPRARSPRWRRRTNIASSVEAAYRRSDMFAQRRELMDKWRVIDPSRGGRRGVAL